MYVHVASLRYPRASVLESVTVACAGSNRAWKEWDKRREGWREGGRKRRKHTGTWEIDLVVKCVCVLCVCVYVRSWLYFM